MALADFTPSRKEITWKGQPLAQVRGLSLVDLSVLVRYHGDDMRAVYDAVVAPGADPMAVLMSETVMVRVVTMAPDLSARLISLAADEPDGMAGVKRMSAPLQVTIMREIAVMTFEDVGGPKAFAALVGLAMGGAAKSLPGEFRAEQLRAPIIQ